MITQDIENSIRDGLFNAYLSLMGSSNEGDFRAKITEYLNTVFIFTELINSKKHSKFGNYVENLKYAVCLEYSAWLFYQNAFNVFGFYPGAAKNEQDRNPPPPPPEFTSPDNGRIDIVIIHKLVDRKLVIPNKLEDGKTKAIIKFVERSISGIEVKGINPSKKLLLADYERLAICLDANWHQNDVNSISCCFIGYIKAIGGEKRPTSLKEIMAKKERIKKKQEAIFGESEYSLKLNTEVKVFEIHSYPVEDYRSNTPEELWEKGDAAFQTGAVFGIVVTLTRKSI